MKLLKQLLVVFLYYEALPEGFAFQVNKILKRSDLGKLIEMVYYQFGKDATVHVFR